MTFVVTAWSENPGELRRLHKRVIEERSIRGRARIVEVETEGDRLGPLVDSLQVTLASGVATAAFADMVVTWLGTRPAEVTVRLTRDEHEIVVSADEVAVMPPAAARELTERLTEMFDGDHRHSL
ncbi:hypothetical protein GCM10009677_56730 [Sphaerisporangium rubeum]|uniref:Uncharacterized protein n=1 Tax=Sphaerisporangium rubeum TaxID=321317 RepID=A0A7X0IDP9_9ACTN|nr:hypothetical protein [Sphaerisporangium rubeum]MBB6473048.1 hypothetical protein [Sphaerisporangium rubeum]